MGRRGSVAVEQDNSSLILYLNDGNKKDHTFFADPHTFVNKTLQRQRMHTNLTNDMIFLNVKR